MKREGSGFCGNIEKGGKHLGGRGRTSGRFSPRLQISEEAVLPFDPQKSALQVCKAKRVSSPCYSPVILLSRSTLPNLVSAITSFILQVGRVSL